MTKSQALAILQVSSTTSTEDVKRRFLQLALEHHPDKGGDTETFVQLRKAFECLQLNEDWTESTYDDWFFEETGEHLSGFYMDEQTKEEVVEAFQTLSPGGRDMGEWELARHVSERHESRGEDPLQLTVGTPLKSSQRRRRRFGSR